jgi:hypothetical protein
MTQPRTMAYSPFVCGRITCATASVPVQRTGQKAPATRYTPAAVAIMITAIQRSVATHDNLAVSPTPGTDEVRRVLEVVAQALTVIAPLAARLREKLHQDDDAIAFEMAVRRAVEAIRSLQPAQTHATSPSDTV